MTMDWFWLVIGVCVLVIFFLIMALKDLLTVPREPDAEDTSDKPTPNK